MRLPMMMMQVAGFPGSCSSSAEATSKDVKMAMQRW